MKRKVERWSVADLRQSFGEIDFPEYQREPTLWQRSEKQLLIDSMVRNFDIASLYLYETDEGKLECVDGRQRIGAIMSFVGENPKDADNGFPFQTSNEIYTDEAHPFMELDGAEFAKMEEAAKITPEGADARLVKRVVEYKLTVVMLSESERPEEFNLQFTRLNLGVTIISGERLRAMVGELRDVCFKQLGGHPLLRSARMSTRRYAKEQTAAQIVAQVFAYEAEKGRSGERGYARTRYFDLQKLLKDNGTLSETKQQWIVQLTNVMNELSERIGEEGVLTSRAMTVSAVMFAYDEAHGGEWDATEGVAFVRAFGAKLQWQVKKRLDYDKEYRYLMDFQREVTQASVEKRAVRRRARVLREQFEVWRENGRLRGDEAYEERTGERSQGAE